MRVLALMVGRFLYHFAFRGRLDYVSRQEVQIAGTLLLAWSVRHNTCKMSRLGHLVKSQKIQTDPLPKIEQTGVNDGLCKTRGGDEKFLSGENR